MKLYRAHIIIAAQTIIFPLFSNAQDLSAPLSQIVKAPVQDCRSGNAVTLPIITWGGDIATIFANGNQANTAKNSIFDKEGAQLKLSRQDDFAKQLSEYLNCNSPYLRGTVGMISMAADLLHKDPRTTPKVIYQLTWSAGGDAMIVKSGIRTPKDLKGKTVAVQAYGPHVDYLTKILSDAGLSPKDIKIRWTKDITGSDASPLAAFKSNDVHAAMVIMPDALAATSGGGVGTGSEDSVKGATVLLSTKSASKIISDVYAVRSDYFNKERGKVEALTRALLKGEEQLKELFKNKESRKAEYQQMLAGSAELLLDSSQATKDVEGMYGDAEFVGFSGNVNFFANAAFPRSLERISDEAQSAFLSLGLLSKSVDLAAAGWNYDSLKGGLSTTSKAEAQRFDPSEVARVISKKQAQGTLDQGGLFSFEIYFKPNQNDFSADLYKDAFDKAITLAATYGGAIITVEGHSDPLGYLKAKKQNNPELVLKQIRQSAKNLSLSRANGVRDSLTSYAQSKGINLDPSQLAIVGYGIDKPKAGMCGGDPCAPKTEQEWLDNMRVEFRIVQVEAESSVFKPL